MTYILNCKLDKLKTTYEPQHEQNSLPTHADNDDSDQPSHRRAHRCIHCKIKLKKRKEDQQQQKGMMTLQGSSCT